MHPKLTKSQTSEYAYNSEIFSISILDLTIPKSRWAKNATWRNCSWFFSMIVRVISCIIIIDTYMIYQLYNIITITISPNTNYWF
jgi:hypothetical protein